MRLAEPLRSRAIERIFDLRNDAAVQRAREALDALLTGVYGSAWPDVAWEFSRLTGDGFPVEFVFSTQDDDIRYTCEVAGPETAESERLGRAEHLLVEMGSVAPDPSQMDFLRAAQATGPLTWGTWVGGRHGPRDDSYKLYVECPAASGSVADRWIERLAGSRDLLQRRATALRIAAYEPARSRMEFYFKTEDLEPGEVGALLRRFGLGARQGELLDLIAQAWGRPIRDRLPVGNSGFSIAAPLAGVCHAFSLHFYARSVFGGDARIRRRLLELARKMRWNLGAYAECSAPLAQRDDARTLHGIVSFTVADGREPVLQVGLRPPEQVV